MLRIATLDSLRGIASFAVMWFHFTSQLTPYIGGSVIHSSGKAGWLGVPVFFVISGFIIPYSLHKSGYQRADYGRFLLKRIARLDPPYLLSIVVILAHQYWLTTRPSYHGVPYHVSVPQLLCHLGYVNVFFGYEWLNPVFWSLAIEFQYYLAIGLLFPVLFNRATYRPVFAGLLLLSLIPHAAGFIFQFLGLFLFGFAALYYLLKMIALPKFLLSLGIVAAFVAFVLGWPSAIAGLLTALAIAFVRVQFRPLAFLGQISYSLYLLHSPIGLPLLGLGMNKIGHPIVTLAASIAVVLGIAYGYFWAVERPSQRLSSRLRYNTPPVTAGL